MWFFFFKQKTAYEMRISDWSSDVCSSDLVKLRPGDTFSRKKMTETSDAISECLGEAGYAFANVNASPEVDKQKASAKLTFFVDRSEERRVGKECVSTCRSRWSPSH